MDNWLRNISVVRIVALALGILLWVVVDMDEQNTTGSATSVFRTQEIRNVNIEKIGFDEAQYFIKSIQPAVVTVKIRGRESALKKVNPKNMQIQLDLSAVSEGTHSLRLKELGFPAGVEVEIVPENVTVMIEKKQKKELPVDIDVVGSPAPGFKAGLPITTPSRVHVTAPTSLLDEIEFVRAEVNIEGAESSITTEVKLAAYNKSGAEVQVAITPSVVDVDIPITSPFKSMPLQVRLVGQTPSGYSVASYKQSVNEVTAYGPQEILDSLDFYEGGQINLSELTADKVFTLNIPLKGEVEQIVPKKVEIEIDIVPSETKTFEKVDITISGGNNENEMSFIAPEDGKIDLTLEAAPSLLKKLTLDDIEAIVDVSNLPEGKHELLLVLKLPPYVKKATGEEVMVAVEIKKKAVETIQTETNEPSSAEVSEETPAAN